MSCTSVVLPEPVAPRTPTVEPAGRWRVTSESTSFWAEALYLKPTWSKSTEPSGTSVRACSGEEMAGFSSSTSRTRRMDVRARAMRRNTLEIIIREFMICRT